MSMKFKFLIAALLFAGSVFGQTTPPNAQPNTTSQWFRKLVGGTGGRIYTDDTLYTPVVKNRAQTLNIFGIPTSGNAVGVNVFGDGIGSGIGVVINGIGSTVSGTRINGQSTTSSGLSMSGAGATGVNITGSGYAADIRLNVDTGGLYIVGLPDTGVLQIGPSGKVFAAPSGGGSSQDLQSVTSLGNQTPYSIEITDGDSLVAVRLQNDGGEGNIQIFNVAGGLNKTNIYPGTISFSADDTTYVSVNMSNIDGSRNIQWPNASGTLALKEELNLATILANGNIAEDSIILGSFGSNFSLYAGPSTGGLAFKQSEGSHFAEIISTSLSEDRFYQLPDADGGLALHSDITLQTAFSNNDTLYAPSNIIHTQGNSLAVHGTGQFQVSEGLIDLSSSGQVTVNVTDNTTTMGAVPVYLFGYSTAGDSTSVGVSISGISPGIGISLEGNSSGGKADISLSPGSGRLSIQNLPNAGDTLATALVRNPITNLLEWAIPITDLQSVTTAGNYTNQLIELRESALYFANSSGVQNCSVSGDPSGITFANGSTSAKVSFNELSASRTYEWPNASGTLALQTPMVSVDYGTTTDISGSAQVFTSGSESGAATVNLLPEIPVGSLVFVSDWGNNASTNNITIDVGSGNNILRGDGTPVSQTLIVDSSGSSFTLRKLTANNWMVIGTNQ